MSALLAFTLTSVFCAVIVLILRFALSEAEKNEDTQKPKILG